MNHCLSWYKRNRTSYCMMCRNLKFLVHFNYNVRTLRGDVKGTQKQLTSTPLCDGKDPLPLIKWGPYCEDPLGLASVLLLLSSFIWPTSQ